MLYNLCVIAFFTIGANLSLRSQRLIGNGNLFCVNLLSGIRVKLGLICIGVFRVRLKASGIVNAVKRAGSRSRGETHVGHIIRLVRYRILINGVFVNLFGLFSGFGLGSSCLGPKPDPRQVSMARDLSN